MSRLNAAKDAYLTETGKPLPITSGYRTTEEQAKLFANRGSNPNLVAPPGTSKHEVGNAADISPTVPSSFLDRFGLHRPYGSKDPVHVEANPSFQGSVAQSSAPSSNFADLWESAPQATTAQATTEQAKTDQPKSLTEASARARKDLEPIANILPSVASLADTTVGSILPFIGKQATYAVGRALQQTPAEAEATSNKVSGFLDKPFGKALGVTEAPAYKGEASQRLMEFIGENVSKGADWIAQKTGLPVNDVQNMIGTATLAVGKGAEVTAKPIAKSIGNFLKEREIPPAELAIRRGQSQPIVQENLIPQPSLVGVGAARAELNPYPKLTGEEIARGEMPQIKFEKMAGSVNPNEQATRAEIINKINPYGRPRTGLITGNEDIIRNEYTLANSSERTPAGNILKQEIANEQQALPAYAENIVKNTGADQNLLDNESRAYRVRNALDSKEGLYKDIETAKSEIYQDAFKAVGDNPVEASTIEGLLNNKQFQAELKLKKLQDFTGGAKELLDLHKTEGFEGTLPNSIAGLEKLRQSLNASWTPENSYAIRRATKAIDEDIAKAGGAETLVKARALHKAEKDLFGSKGIKDLLTEEDVNGIQTGIPNEKLMQKLNIMPNDQWKHIYDTLGKAAKGESIGIKISPEVQEAALAAQAEMKGAIAREIYEAGAAKAGEWNANSVNKIANARMAKIKHSFSPDEIKEIYTLNYGGYLMPAKSPYEGAGMQTQRVNKLSDKLPWVGKVAGAATGIPFAESAGTWAGGKGSSFFERKSQRKEAKELEVELEKNKKLGTKLKDIGK
jgi:LAS superfamily LD-carboxypeptidase LdcB